MKPPPFLDRLMLATILATMVALGMTGMLAGETHDQSYAIPPGTHTAKQGEGRLFTDLAKTGDYVRVTFTAPPGYVLVSTRVEDPLFLGWREFSTHVFRVEVKPGLSTTAAHYADFYGVLRKSATGSGQGGRSGPVDPNPPTPEDLTWDIRGHFKVLKAHEGTGEDQNRRPLAGLTTDKSHARQETEGKARYDTTQDRFIGSLEGQWLGVHIHNPDLLVEPLTRRPKDCQASETKPSPDDNRTPVRYVYLGVDPAARHGGIADPDLIQLNEFQPSPSVADQEAVVAAAERQDQAAQAAVTAAQQADAAAAAAVAKAEADLAAALARIPAVTIAQARVARAEQALKQAEARKTAEEAAFQRETDQYRANPRQGRYANVSDGRAAQLYREATARHTRAMQAIQQEIQRATAELAAARAALQAAITAAATTTAVKAAQTALTAAQQAKAATAAALAQARELARATADSLAKARAKLQNLRDLIARWQREIAAVLVHEIGHRTIYYFHLDRFTNWLNAARIWGYAPTEQRARELALIRYERSYLQRRQRMRQEHEAMQNEYESITQHGITQGRWNERDRLR